MAENDSVEYSPNAPVSFEVSKRIFEQCGYPITENQVFHKLVHLMQCRQATQFTDLLSNATSIISNNNYFLLRSSWVQRNFVHSLHIIRHKIFWASVPMLFGETFEGVSLLFKWIRGSDFESPVDWPKFPRSNRCYASRMGDF